MARLIGLPTPTQNNEAATKKYVDDKVATLDLTAYLPKTGGTMNGNIAMSNNKITGLSDPSALFDAVNLNYLKNAFEIYSLNFDRNPSDFTKYTVDQVAKTTLLRVMEKYIFVMFQMYVFVTENITTTSTGYITLNLQTTTNMPFGFNVPIAGTASIYTNGTTANSHLAQGPFVIRSLSSTNWQVYIKISNNIIVNQTIELIGSGMSF